MAIDLDRIDPQAQYRVVLTGRIILDAETILYPGQDIELRGDLVLAHAEVLDRATPV